MLAQRYLAGHTTVKIASSVEQAVASGRATAGDPLPPIRAAADALRVSPATVAAAYRILRDRGIVITDGRRGTRIRQASPIAAPADAPLPAGVRDLASGNPDPDLLPDPTLALARASPGKRLYGESLNDPDLIAWTRKQFAADDVPASHVCIVSGALDGMERVLREHARAGDRVIVEDPCFTGIADLLASLALTPVPVPVDDEGLLPDHLDRALWRGAAALIITPRAQNPTGAALSAPRARMLRAALRGYPDVLMIEDDHAGVVAGVPYRTLISASTRRWAVVRSVSKSLGPDLRVALMAADATTAARVEGRQKLGIRWVSHILQRVVLMMLRDRQAQRTLQRAARAYANRRATLIAALRKHGIAAHGLSGLNIWIPVPDESSVAASLLAKRWAVNRGERYRIETLSAIRVTIASLEPADATRFADDLAEILAPGGRSSKA